MECWPMDETDCRCSFLFATLFRLYDHQVTAELKPVGCSPKNWRNGSSAVGEVEPAPGFVHVLLARHTGRSGGLRLHLAG